MSDIISYFWTSVYGSGEFSYWRGTESKVRSAASLHHGKSDFDMCETSEHTYSSYGCGTDLAEAEPCVEITEDNEFKPVQTIAPHFMSYIPNETKHGSKIKTHENKTSG